MRAQRRTRSSGHPGPAAQRKRKAIKQRYTRRSAVTAASTPAVTTRARAARGAAAARATAVATPAAATPAAAAAAAAGATLAHSQQHLTGATTRSRAAANGTTNSSSSSTLVPVPFAGVGGIQAAGTTCSNPAGTGTSSSSSSSSSSSKVEKTVSCGICLDEVSSSSMYRLGCRHSFCRGCLASHLKSRLQDRQLPAACPAASCKKAVSQGHAQELLASNPRLCKKFLEATKEASAIARGAAIYCPNSSCSKLVKVTRLTAAAARGLSAAQKAAQQQQLAHVRCAHCSHDCCTSCRCSWHAGLSCASYQALPASEKGEADLALFQLSSSKHWRRCPTCRAMVERTDGCNYMMCRCGEPFCYACGATISTCYNSGCVAGLAAAG